MGVIKQGILGGFSGKVAGVVGSSWKGIAVMKSLPLSVANPNTAGQQAQRGAMTQVVAAARLLLASVIGPFWNKFAQKMSGYNMFVKTNIKAFTTAGFTNPSVFFSQRGSLINFAAISAQAVSGTSQITVQWTDNTGVADALSTDEGNIVYYNATQDYWGTQTNVSTRQTGGYTFLDATMNAADVLEVYVGATRPDDSIVSDSFYAQVVVS